LWAAQTPQVFRYDMLREAHERAQGEATDDAALVESLGYQVKVFDGSPRNIKVTTAADLAVVEALLAQGRAG
jgi:2-C-methyl-D-erythritol 4-phosphate cytidylyltransferase